MEIDRTKLIKNKFFSGFAYDEIDEIVLLSKMKRMNMGEVFVYQDDYNEEEFYFYYVILEGSVNVIVHDTLLSTLGVGECFGEASYLTGNQRTAMIKAREDGTAVLQIDGMAVDEQGTQELRYKLMRGTARSLVERLSRTTEIATLQVGPTEGLDQKLSPPDPQSPKPAQSPETSTITPEEQEKIYKDNSAKVKLMEASDFFKGFSRNEILELLFFRNVFSKHPNNKKIVSQGDKDRSFFIIIKGSANVVKDGTLLKKLVKGDSFGEMSILHGLPRTADVISDNDCCTIRIDAIVLEKAVLPLQLKFYMKFSRILATRLELANIRH